MIQVVTNIHYQVGKIGRIINQINYLDDQQFSESSIEEILLIARTVSSSLDEMEHILDRNRALQLIDMVRGNFGDYMDGVNVLLQDGIHMERRSFIDHLHAIEMTRTLLIADLEEFIAFQEGVMNEVLDDAYHTYERALVAFIIASVAAVLISLFFALWVIRSMTSSLVRVSSVMKNIDYNSEHLPRLAVTTQDEVGDISAAFNTSAQELEDHERAEREHKAAMERDAFLKS